MEQTTQSAIAKALILRAGHFCSPSERSRFLHSARARAIFVSCSSLSSTCNPISELESLDRAVDIKGVCFDGWFVRIPYVDCVYLVRVHLALPRQQECA